SVVSPALAQGKKLKTGGIYDYTGPLAGGGSDLHALGAKIMIDYFAKKGGVEGYAIEATYADAQSKPDVAINEAVRLVEQEKVDMLLGFYSSAQCVPVAARVEQLKKFMWITTCISSATPPALSALLIKLKRARPDVLFHTGYNPDIALFLRQAREQGLRFHALVGHGAGYGVYDKLKEAVGKDVNYVFNVDPISIWL